MNIRILDENSLLVTVFLLIKIIATSDIHSPRYLDLFIKSMDQLIVEPDLIILAGDLVEKNNIHAFKQVYDYLMNKYSKVPVIAVFGNEEYRGYENKYREQYGGIKWLNDEYVIIDLRNFRIGLIGTRGALDKPTPWQFKNIPGIVEYYNNLPIKVSNMVDDLIKQRVDLTILVSHYGVTYKNLEGEPRSIWFHLASRRFEEVIINKKIDLVIHGHIHNGLKDIVYVDSTPIYNVSLPARGGVQYIEIGETRREKVKGLEKWFMKNNESNQHQGLKPSNTPSAITNASK